MIKRVIFGITVLLGLATAAFLPASAAARRVIDDSDTVGLAGNVHPHARPEFDAGPTESSLAMERMILSLRLNADRQARLDKLLAEQQDPASPRFHRWLTPEEFGESFGPEPGDVEAITRWLTSHGFTVDEVAKSRGWINFSGKVSDVERAFHVKMRNYYINGKLRHANANDPAIPRGLADMVAGIVSLHNFPRKTMNSGLRSLVPEEPGSQYTSGSTHYLAPGDFATIYNVNPLYNAGIDGSGQSIAIVGRTHPSSTNWATFRSAMGLPANPPQVIVNGTDPGDLGGGEDNEADLDVEWSGAVAKNATIKFVVSKSTASTDGVDLSAQYIVNNNLAPVMTTSFGECESQLGRTERSFYNNLWQQAAAQGITSFVSTGDSGAAGCNLGSDTSGSGAAVNGLASTPHNVAVGGTQFSEGSGTYWNTGNGTGYTSAVSYIPETAWNESGSVSGGSGLWSTGGGASSYYGKPSWQVCQGVPADSKRDLPDVSLTAAMHDGYLVQTQGALYAIGGTSASSPSFAGLMALIVQKTGQRQGNANTRFYQLGAAQVGAGGATVFHDTTSGNNSVPGVTGYTCTTGYDPVTGLGSVDANALVNNWTPDFAISATPAYVSVPQRSSGTFTITTTVSGNFSNAVSLSASGLPTGATAAFNPVSIDAPGAGGSTLTISAATAATPGTFPVTITGTGGNVTHTASVNLTVIQVFDITASVANGVGGTITPVTATVLSGGSATFSITPATGYHLAGLTDNGADVTAGVTDGSYTISNVSAAHDIVATFAINTYSVTASVSGGNGAVTPASSAVNYGGNITLTISPATGYQLATLTDNGASVTAIEDPPGTFTYSIDNVTAPHVVQATFTAVAAAPVPAMPPFGMSAAFLLAGVLGYAECCRRRNGRMRRQSPS
jgi:subtilase family serine protease